MKKGDMIRVHWTDIASFPTSHPNEAHPISMKTYGHFAGWFTDKKRGRFLCLSDTLCEGDGNGKEGVFYGACAFPKGCIRHIDEFYPLRIRKPKKKKESTKD